MAGRLNLHTRTLLAAASAALFLAGTVPTNAAEVSRVPFQQSVLGKCTTGGGLKICRYTFPKVPDKRRKDIQFVACAVETQKSDPAYVTSASLGVNNGFNFPQLYLIWEARTTQSSLSLTISQPVVFSISAGDAAQIAFEFEGTLSAILSCNISGESVTLQ